MGNKKRKEPLLIENIAIIDTANKGKSIAKHEGRAIFVEGGVPGDVCNITVFKRRKKFWEARIDKIHTYSKLITLFAISFLNSTLENYIQQHHNFHS